ncbi:GNAT family N-acetyltransferase [Chloroflexota bacterium]
MPDLKIRRAVATDIKTLMDFDHSVKTNYVWQFDLNNVNSQTSAIFREIRLPRSVLIEYPKTLTSMVDDWNRRSTMFVAVFEDKLCGYLRITENLSTEVSWVTDLVISPNYRRKGVAANLIFTSINWSADLEKARINIETTSKNHPAISLYKKLGFEFCGYNDQYYDSNNVALFFGRELR